MSWYEYCFHQDDIPFVKYYNGAISIFILVLKDHCNVISIVYLIINVIFTLLYSIFMNFKVFLLIFDISIFM